MLEKTKGIVLKTHKYSETSIICRVFTRQLGLLSFIVPGIRSAKKGKGNVLQPGQILDLDCYYYENKNLLRFKEFKVDFIPSNIHRDIRKFSVLIFLIDLMGQLVNDKEINMDLFDHLYQTTKYIDTHDINGAFPLHQLLEISRIMGFFPSDNYSIESSYFNLTEGSFQRDYYPEEEILTTQTSLWMHQLLSDERIPHRDQRQQLLEILLQYYRLHIPNMKALRSQEILHDLLG